MIIKKLELKNINSYGNNLQTIEFDQDGGLIYLQGKNGAGKCLSPDTEIEIDVSDQMVYNELMNFLEKIHCDPFTKEFWIKKGIIDSEEIEFCIKSQRKLNIEYWIKKGFSEEESIKKVAEYQKENASKANIKIQNSKDTIEYKEKHDTHIEYYLSKGFDLETSKQMLKDRQTTFTLEKCIHKYGEERGKEIYKTRQDKWIKKVFNKDTCIAAGRSLISDKFIENIIKFIDDKNITDNFLYGLNEKFIYDSKLKKPHKYDLCYMDKIIEFHGDFWHANPQIFESHEIHRVKKIECGEVWKKDKRKIESAKEHGYNVLVIWESDYLKILKIRFKNALIF